MKRVVDTTEPAVSQALDRYRAGDLPPLVATTLARALLDNRSNALGWDTVVCTGCTRVGGEPGCCPDHRPVAFGTIVNAFEAAEKAVSCETCLHEETLSSNEPCNDCSQVMVSRWEARS